MTHPTKSQTGQHGWLSPRQFAAFAAAGTDAHRIFSGAGGWVERLGADVLVSFKSDSARDEMLAALPGWAAANDWQPQRI